VRGGATGLDIILDEEEEMENELDYENSVKHGKQSPNCFFHGTTDAIQSSSNNSKNLEQDFFSSKRGHITGSQLKRIKNSDA
jgi:hypothetical protein